MVIHVGTTHNYNLSGLRYQILEIVLVSISLL